MSASAQTSEGEDAAGHRLGTHVRALRHARGLTLVKLADATDLSHPFLSQIERGLARPSLASLRRIAVALGTSPLELIAAGEERSATERGTELHSAGDGAISADFAVGTARMLAHGDRPFHPMEYISDNTEPGETFVHGEDEFVYVLEGAVNVDLGGEVTILAVGQSAYYPGGVSHRWWSADGAAYRMLVVKQGPKLSGLR